MIFSFDCTLYTAIDHVKRNWNGGVSCAKHQYKSCKTPLVQYCFTLSIVMCNQMARLKQQYIIVCIPIPMSGCVTAALVSDVFNYVRDEPVLYAGIFL